MHDRCILVLKECQNHSLQLPCESGVAPFLGAVGFVASPCIFLRIGLGLELLMEENGIHTGISYFKFSFQLHLSLDFWRLFTAEMYLPGV